MLTPNPEMSPLRQQTLREAKKHVGEHELAGHPNQGKPGEVIEQIQSYFGNFMDGEPWCAAFATYMIHIAAKSLGVHEEFIKSASSSAIYDWAKAAGHLLSAPEPGCVGLVKAGVHAAPGKSHEHTFLVHDVLGGGSRVLTVEGNWSNMVRWNHRDVTSNYHWVRIS